MVRNLPAMQETGLNPWVRKIPWRREWLPRHIFLSGEFHGQRRLAGYSPWGQKELDVTEQLTIALSKPMFPKLTENYSSLKCKLKQNEMSLHAHKGTPTRMAESKRETIISIFKNTCEIDDQSKFDA